MSTNYVVSICMITYNHEQFIAEAIEGVLMQDTNFDYQLVIGEDCSTDGTGAVCKLYAEKYPNKIRLLPTSDNLGMMPNFIKTLKECKGGYIAICEGDDYWTDPLKLQKQVDFLEENNSYVITTHGTNIWENGNVIKREGKGNITYRLEHFIKETKVGSATCSILFKNKKEILEEIVSNAFVKSAAGDWLLCVIALKYGWMFHQYQTMAVYRVHDGGVYSSKSWVQQFKIHLSTALSVDKFLSNIYHVQVVNYNIRRLFLAKIKESTLSDEDFWSLYKGLEDEKWRLMVTKFMISSPLSKVYLKYLSKMIFSNLKIK